MPAMPDHLTRRDVLKSFLAAGLAAGTVRPALAEPAAAPLRSREPWRLLPESKSWQAHWITHPDAARAAQGVYLFRSALTLEAVPRSLPVKVSADQRFNLLVNGRLIGSGPALSDPWHWRYERFDLAAALRPGVNIVAAVVWFGEGQSVGLAQMGVAPAFVLSPEQDDGSEDRWTDLGPIPALATGSGQWRVHRDTAHSFLPIQHADAPGYAVIGPMDRLDAAHHPWGWQEAQFDASSWVLPLTLERARPREFNDGPGDGWRYLERSPIEQLEHAPEPLGKIVRVEGLDPDSVSADALVIGPIVVPGGAAAKVLIDHLVYTTALPTLDVEGGAGATIRLRYAEALIDAQGEKGHRDQIEGKHCRGYADEFVLDGGRRSFEPLYWRAFRYLQIEVETADASVELRGLVIRFVGAPLAPLSRFNASDATLNPFWAVGVRTVRCNAHETFTDGPYWEQLSYPGDCRLSCLTALSFAGSRAQPYVRNALQLFDDSRMPEGLTQSRYPSRETQIIPPYSLWYVCMLHDYWMYSDAPGDAGFVAGRLTGVFGVLDWFLRRVNPRGLIGPLPWWNFVDWSFRHGVPPGTVEEAAGGSSILTLQLILALQAAAALETGLGRVDLAGSYAVSAAAASAAVRRECWDARRGLMADIPLTGGPVPYSQHATALALLAGVLSSGEKAAAARGLLELLHSEPKGVTRATLYFRYYVHRALIESGAGDRYLEWMAPWRDALALGLTTWPEVPGHSRSDCHGWSAHPTREFLATILGITSAAPGFRAVTIAPHLGKLDWAGGAQAHPRGEIAVRFQRTAGGLEADIALPAEVPGTLLFQGRSRPIRGRFQGVI